MSLKIDRLSPSPVKVGWEGDLTIYGKDFREGGFVAIDGKEPKVQSWTSTQIVVKVTKTFTDKPGNKRLVVHENNGGFDETHWKVENGG